jgi:hypothetical protein
MWFRRSFRQRRPPPPVLLPSLERLAELIERVVVLLDEVAVSPARGPAPQPARHAVLAANPAPNPVRNPVSTPVPNPGPSVDGHLLLVASVDGYRLLEREGAPPAQADLVEIDGDDFIAVRLGPSPLPGDRRRCAYLERQEPPKADRTFDR